MVSQQQQVKRLRDDSPHEEPSPKREKESASRTMKKIIREAASRNGFDATAINRGSVFREIIGNV
jgi:hypothetical protein